MAETKSLAYARIKCAIVTSLQLGIMLFFPIHTYANPWLPESGGWKYSLQYSKYDTPKSIKFYERDLYFSLDKAIVLNNKAEYIAKIIFGTKIANEAVSIFMRQNPEFTSISWSQTGDEQNTNIKLVADGKIFVSIPKNSDIEILEQRQNNKIDELSLANIQLKNLQNYLITSYHHWAATTDIEYGLNERFSYGVGIGAGQETNKYKTNTKVDKFSIFFKSKLYDKKGYIFTLRPKFLTIGPIYGADLTAMLGKSHKMKHKVFGKKVEVFGYSSFGITKFLNSNIIKNKLHAEITSGIKWNDSTILMNQESEDFNPGLSKTYKRVLRSQFTVAQDLNFASIEHRNKVYLTLSYFTIDSLKARRRLSAGYSIGLWLEF